MKQMAAAVLAAAMLLAPAYGECRITGEALSVGADAAVVMEYESGRLLFAQNADGCLPMASTTKIMTALLTLEQPEPDAVFTVDETAILVEGSSMGLEPGDRVSLRALAAGMLMSSGNDAANAAAARIAGKASAFAFLMNERARELGMDNTNFVTPSGLDAENHYSTARDLALLARAALGNPAFAEMAASKQLRVCFGNPPYERILYNHNKLLHYYPEAIGVKTGFTKSAGRCLVSAARREGGVLICVTLGCPDDWNVHQYLYERYLPRLSQQALTPQGTLSIPVVGGVRRAVALRQQDALAVTAVAGMPREATQRVYAEKFLYAPVKAGDIVGRIVYYIDGKAVGESALAAQDAVEAVQPEPAPWWKFWQR